GGHQHAHGQDVAAVGDDHRGVAGPGGVELAAGADLDDGVVVAAEVAQRGDVLAGAVGEGGPDAQPAGPVGAGEGVLGGRDVERGDGAAAPLPAGALGDPVPQQPVGPRPPGEAAAAAVRHLAGALEQDKAAAGVGAVDAAALEVPGQRQVVLLRVI